MTIAEAIQDFRAAAIAKSDFVSPASRDHAFHARMARAFNFLTTSGSEGFAAFNALLCDDSPHVRGWVAAQLLSQSDKSALQVMEKLATEPGIRGFTAAITLQEFRAGKLCSSFTER